MHTHTYGAKGIWFWYEWIFQNLQTVGGKSSQNLFGELIAVS